MEINLENLSVDIGVSRVKPLISKSRISFLCYTSREKKMFINQNKLSLMMLSMHSDRNLFRPKVQGMDILGY